MPSWLATCCMRRSPRSFSVSANFTTRLEEAPWERDTPWVIHSPPTGVTAAPRGRYSTLPESRGNGLGARGAGEALGTPGFLPQPTSESCLLHASVSPLFSMGLRVPSRFPSMLWGDSEKSGGIQGGESSLWLLGSCSGQQCPPGGSRALGRCLGSLAWGLGGGRRVYTRMCTCLCA